MEPVIVKGNLLDQPVEVIVNAWNQNTLSWQSFTMQGVSGAIRRRGGITPFQELARIGPIPLGGAVMTGAGELPYKAVIHVAGINLHWRATEYAIQQSVRSAMALVMQHHFSSIAFPIIGAGTGGFEEEKALQLMLNAFAETPSAAKIIIVKFEPH